MSEFSYEIEVTVRFRDLDPVGHVNNAVYATYLEHARTNYIEDVFGVAASEAGVVVANVSIDYRQPIETAKTVTVAMSTTDLGTSSIHMEYEIRMPDAVAATASSVIVTVDEDGKPCPIPDRIRERITEFEGL